MPTYHVDCGYVEDGIRYAMGDWRGEAESPEAAVAEAMAEIWDTFLPESLADFKVWEVVEDPNEFIDAAEEAPWTLEQLREALRHGPCGATPGNCPICRD